MSQVRFIADLHFGHKFMAEHRGFESIEAHDEHVINQWNSVVNKRDITYILGDITMEKSDSYPLLNRLNGIKKVVLGNHDKAAHVPELLKYVNSVAAMVQYKGIFLTHCPIHPMEMDCRVHHNIHGHIHGKVVMLDHWSNIPDQRYHCVSCEHVDFKPKTLEQLGIKR